jgi:glycosyltransferase involved in cell wall biosynthesis
MTVTALEPGQSLGAPRGSTAICIPVDGSLDVLYRCLRDVVTKTPDNVPVLVVDRLPADPALARFLTGLERGIHQMTLPDSGAGPVALANAGLSAVAKADVVLLSSHALVPEGWIGRLSEAGCSDTTVGTASAFGDRAGLLSLGDEAVPGDLSVDEVAARLAAGSPRLRPQIPAGDGPAVWIARAALELAGPLDPDLGSLGAAMIDFSQRSLALGLVNVVADDVFVASVNSSAGGWAVAGDDEALLEQRYPYLETALEEQPWPGLSRARALARRSLGKITVTVDARIVRGSFSGADAETMELIQTLSRLEPLSVRVLHDPAIGPEAQAMLEGMPEVERLSAADVPPGVQPSEIVHRPYQATSVEDLELLSRLGRRIVITHLDLIAFHNPSYFAKGEAWHQHRRVTRIALAMADQVIFLSRHVAEEAIREGLVEDQRAHVMPMVVESPQRGTRPRPPAGVPPRPFLLSIGNDFHHKNRLFAIKLLEELRARGWDGSLVLAGAAVEHGSSRGQEAAYLAARPALAGFVHELKPVDQDERAWLYANAAAAVYPSVREGFGLVPLEAALSGTPSLFAAQTSLAEILPHGAAVLVPWDASASAERALPLLADGEDRDRHIEMVLEASRRMPDWDANGRRLLDLYEQAMRLPVREAASLAGEAQVREAQLARWIRLKEAMGEIVGPDAPVPADAQRGLIAIATRRRLRRPVFWLLGALYRIGFRARRL